MTGINLKTPKDVIQNMLCIIFRDGPRLADHLSANLGLFDTLDKDKYVHPGRRRLDNQHGGLYL